MANDIIYRQPDFTRRKLEAKNIKDAKKEATLFINLDKLASIKKLSDFRVSSSSEQNGEIVLSVSFLNFESKTSHSGSIRVKASDSVIDQTVAAAKQLDAVPAVEEKVEPKTNLVVSDIKFIKDGSTILVQSNSFGRIAVFSAEAFVEANKKQIEAAIQDGMEGLGAKFNLEVSYTLPELTDIQAAASAAVEPEISVPKVNYEEYLKEIDPALEAEASLNEFTMSKWARLNEDQQQALHRLLAKIQISIENETFKVLRGMKLDALKILSSPAPQFALDGNGRVRGVFTVRSSFVHDNDYKTLDVPVSVESNTYAIPSQSSLLEAINGLRGDRARSNEKFAKESGKVFASISTDPIVKEAAIQKQATPSPVENPVAPILNINKTQLPGVKVGDIINIDGIRYKITDGDMNKLSERGEGVLWTLVPETSGKGEVAEAIPAY